MKKALLFICILIIPFSISAKTVSNSISYNTTSFSVDNSILMVIDNTMGVAYRFISYPKDTGFYLGVDTSVGIPISMITYTNLLGIRVSDSPRDLLLGVKAPFGMRWAGTDKAMGFFIGGGPAYYLISNFNYQSSSALGVFGELGFETNKTSDIGFFISLQSSICALIANGSFVQDFATNSGSLNIGMTWRRKKD